MKFSVREIVRGALVGALYALLTLVVEPISSGLIQFRVSEALTVLPFFFHAAVPGLFVGCVIANVLVGASLYDIIFGSLATLIAAQLTYLIGKNHHSALLAPFPPVILNALIVGALLTYVYGIGVPYWVSLCYVGLGEAVICYVLGYPLLKACEKWPAIIGDKVKSNLK